MFSILGYILAFATSTSIGVVIGGVMSSGKVVDLYRRSDELQGALIEQAHLISELSSAVNRLLNEVERQHSHNIGQENIQYATEVLKRARKLSPLENWLEED